MIRRLCAILAAVALVACAPAKDPANPALWEITGPGGAHGWLFGTIHALPRPAAWRTARVEAALAGSDTLVVEIAALNDDGATARAFQRLARSEGAPPLSRRVAPALAAPLAALEAKAGLRDADFANTGTWAAALMLAQASEGGAEPGNGIDRELLAHAGGKPVAELEGAARQLAAFAALPEPAQRALLAEVITGAPHADADMRQLASAWRRGDMAAIERETHTGLLADPTLHRALYVDRNRAWAASIAARLAAGGHPFVAVGAAHMAGPEGLVAMLGARGYSVRRVE